MMAELVGNAILRINGEVIEITNIEVRHVVGDCAEIKPIEFDGATCLRHDTNLEISGEMTWELDPDETRRLFALFAPDIERERRCRLWDRIRFNIAARNRELKDRN